MTHLRRRKLLTAGLTALAVSAGAPAASQAESLYAVTDGNGLISFDSNAPRGISTPVQISGLQSGEKIIGIDVRPATDQLYGLGSTHRLYVINPVTGATRGVSGTAFTPALTSANAGFDFNPTADRIRVTTDTDQNLRLNPETGATAATDGKLAYLAGDSGANADPGVIASGYTNSVAGAASTQLFDIDAGRDQLVLQDPPNAGSLKTIGALGVDVDGRGGFDVGTQNVGYAALTPKGQTRALLYTIDLVTGKANPAATDPTVGTSSPIVALAANGPNESDTNNPTVVVANPNVKSATLVRSDGVAYTVACSEACTVRGELRRGSILLGTASSFVEQPGRVSIKIELTSSGRALLANVRSGVLSLRTIAADYSNNRETVTRTITLTK